MADNRKPLYSFRITDDVQTLLDGIWALRPELNGNKAVTAKLALAALLREIEFIERNRSTITQQPPVSSTKTANTMPSEGIDQINTDPDAEWYEADEP